MHHLRLFRVFLAVAIMVTYAHCAFEHQIALCCEHAISAVYDSPVDIANDCHFGCICQGATLVRDVTASSNDNGCLRDIVCIFVEPNFEVHAVELRPQFNRVFFFPCGVVLRALDRCVATQSFQI